MYKQASNKKRGTTVSLSTEHRVMIRLQSSTALTEPQPIITRKAALHTAQPTPPVPPNHATPAEIWLLIVTGCLSAAVVTTLSSRLPNSHTLTWAAIFLLSIRYIALAAAAGAIGTAIPWFFLRRKLSFTLTFLIRTLITAWIFFPCILLFYRRQSPWIYLVIALTTTVIALNLRSLFPPRAETNQLPYRSTSDLPALYGLPIAAFRPFRAFFIAICTQSAIICAITGRLLPASVLTATSLSLLASRWSASEINSNTTFTGKRPSLLLCASALSFTILALLPWVSAMPHSLFGPSVQFHHPPRLAPPGPIDTDIPSTEYVGIVLWPPPQKKTQIVPPAPHIHSFVIGRVAQPVVIPFDGPYWYFKAPSTRPSPRAHVAHGDSTAVTIRSSDWSPLLMQAHQNLGLPIDLNCCSEIDVAITNADIRPGTIALGLRLTDTNSIGKPSLTLADRTILSSTAAQIPLNRAPVKEILRFPITQSETMHQFSEIDVLFHPAKERARGGVKVSIQTFTLIPK
jgi:hypothetical protein